jgi:hypothetical protein
MRMRRVVTTGAWAAVVAAGVLAAGCRVDEHKNGDNENVKISTPFGGLSVKTNDAAAQNGSGLDVYPGAVPEKKEKGNDGAADVNLSFGGFHLGVKASSYTTPDAPEKVLAFYRKDMGKFGTVIQCTHDHAVGTPVRTQDGLTCDHDSKNEVHVNDDDDDANKTELKAGSKQHQHMVEVTAKGTGTKFGLVMLDLPGKFSDSDSDDKQ